jgi:hypothetical protein
MRPCCIPLLSLVAGALLYAQDTSAPKVWGHVFSADGSAVSGATVTIAGPAATPPGQSTAKSPCQSACVEVTGSSPDPGSYSFPEIQPGAYDITAAKSEYRSQARKIAVASGSPQRIDFVLDAVPDSYVSGLVEAWVTPLVVFLFLGSVWLVRWHNIARPNREMLTAELEKVRARFRNDTGLDLAQDELKHLDSLLESADNALKRKWTFLFDFLFWSRGQEITGWELIHEFQRDAIRFAYGDGSGFTGDASLGMIRARLQSVELDLLDIDKTHAKTLAGNIKDALENVKDEETLRALLVEALTYVNDEDDSGFAQLTGWQTKAVWVSTIGCGLIVVLALVIGNSVLFVAGASGGYLSRLARQLKRADLPTDYGASWTTLFLSPVAGALSGWFGILLIVALADSRFQVLGAAFQGIKWHVPFAPLTLGLAFALGFSERIFDGIVSSLENRVDKDRQAATQSQQPTSTTKDPPPGPSIRDSLAGGAPGVGKPPEAVKGPAGG